MCQLPPVYASLCAKTWISDVTETQVAVIIATEIMIPMMVTTVRFLFSFKCRKVSLLMIFIMRAPRL